MDRPAHYFPRGGACVWCHVSSEMVADRKAPPYCEERPEETWKDVSRETANEVGGY